MDRTISVSEFSFYISKIFQNETFLHNIDILGEVSSYNVSQDIAYITLKDTNALLQCILFSAKKNYQPKIGEKVIVTGSPSYYIKGGRFSFNCTKIKPYGEGDIFKRFMEMKDRLSKEGLFDISHKKQMPKDIKNIGVITSKQGAVIQDIINVSTRRNPSVNIILFPAKVQGIGAEVEIAKGIEFFNDYNVDVVIVARGGGSSEDLEPFNTEIVARAVYNSNKFIVSAVGHETDYTIIDYVSDLRAPTPSAAAELVCKDVVKEQYILKNNINTFLMIYKNFISQKQTKVIKAMKELTNNFSVIIDSKIENTLSLQQNMLDIVSNDFEEKQKVLEEIKLKLELLNPLNILSQGYAKIEKDSKSIISINNVSKDDKIEIKMIDGDIVAMVVDKRSKV